MTKKDEYDEAIKGFLFNLMIIGFENDGFRLNVLNERPWELPLPEEIKDAKFITLDISGWTLEESYITDDGIFIRTAFGEIENSKEFYFDEIINIGDREGNTLYHKTMKLKSPVDEVKMEKIPGVKSFKVNEDSEGIKRSMGKLRLSKPGKD